MDETLIARLRAETPATAKIVHFNNAGAGLMPDPVFAALTGHLELERRIGGYEAEAEAEPLLAAFYSECAALLGVKPQEIAFIENATRAWDMAFYALPLAEGDRILTHESEYTSNYLGLIQQAARRGISVDLVPSDGSGQIDVAALEAMIGPTTRLIAITHVPSQSGLVNPAEAVGEVARRHGILYLLDACQSAGQIALDVGRIGCDILSGTGRKFLRGPRGTGFLYVRKDLADELEPPFVDLHAATLLGPAGYKLAEGARRFENWETQVAGKVGLGAAMAYARALGLEAIEARVTGLGQRFREALAAVPGARVQDRGARKCGIVSFHLENEPAAATRARLARHGINTSISTGAGFPLDLGPRGIDAVVRASVHYYNTDAEIARFCEVLAQPEG